MMDPIPEEPSDYNAASEPNLAHKQKHNNELNIPANWLLLEDSLPNRAPSPLEFISTSQVSQRMDFVNLTEVPRNYRLLTQSELEITEV